jgi:hypothetical protein
MLRDGGVPGTSNRTKRIRREKMVTEQNYHDLCCENGTDPTEFENQALSIGREFLPVEVRIVMDGGEPTSAYWAWLCSQIDQAYQDSLAVSGGEVDE